MPPLNFVSGVLISKCRSSPAFVTHEVEITHKSSTISYSLEILWQEEDCEVLRLVSSVVHEIDSHLIFYALSLASSS